MMKYESRSVVQSLKQYEMLNNSLRLTTNKQDIKDICIELNRIEERILAETNTMYEKEYMKQISEESDIMDDERQKVQALIKLIEERLQYINNSRKQHQEITGLIAKAPKTLGEDRLDELKNKLAIINKYEKNLKLIDLLNKEITTLDERIKTAQAKIQSNTKQNEKLENRMISLLNEHFRRLDLYSLPERSKEINLAYSELEFSLSKASDNLMKAKKTTNQDLIQECESMLKAASEDYNHYKEKKNILKLLEIYDIKYSSYEELLQKREEINNILRSITGSELYKAVYDELNKQYNTIKIEGQDVKTYLSLTEDKTKKVKLLHEIENENNNEEFTGVIKRLIESENRRKAKAEAERKRHEAEILKHRLFEEQKRKEEMIKRQKEIEEKRKKEIEERTKKLLEEKQKTPVLSPREISLDTNNYTPSHDNDEPKIVATPEESPKAPDGFSPKKLKVEIPEPEDYSFFNKLVDEVEDDDDVQPIVEDTQEPLFFDIKEESSKERIPSPNEPKPDTIPVIKNNNLVPHKVKEELVKEDKKHQLDDKPLEDFSVEDIIFPDMP